MKQYRCPKCGNTYDLMDNQSLPMDENEHYASHLCQGLAEYYCHICLYEFLDKIYTDAGFKLETVE